MTTSDRGPMELFRLHAEICKVLTEPKRLMILDALRHGERSVGELASAIGVSLPNVSQHLAVMRGAGLVDGRRRGTSVTYHLSEPSIVEACDVIHRIVERRLTGTMPLVASSAPRHPPSTHPRNPQSPVSESTMATKTAVLNLEGDGLRFAATSGSGHTIVLDDGHGDTGMRPSELVPMAVAGCTAMDVISILRKKRQDVQRYEIRASGHQQDAHPNEFTRIDVVHVVEGPAIDVEAVRRAIELSATKFCSVGATLSSGGVEIHHAYLVRDGHGEDRMAEVIVTGPDQDPHEPAVSAREAVGATA